MFPELGSTPPPPFFFSRLWSSSPAADTKQEAILLQLHATEANIHELALAIEPSTVSTQVVKRLEVLQQCLKSLESWFGIFERVSPERYVGMSFGIYVQLLTNIIILSRITSPSLRDASAPSTTWDPAEIRKTFNLVGLLDRLANNFDACIAATGVLEDEPGEESSTSPSEDSVLSRILCFYC